MKEFSIKSKIILVLLQALVFGTGALLSYNNFKILSFVVFEILAFGSYFIMYTKTHKMINAIGIFNLSWIGGIGLSCLKLSKLQRHWYARTWIAFLAAYITFEIIYYLAENIMSRKTQSKLFIKTGKVNSNRILNCIVVTTILSLMATGFEWYKCGYLPIFSDAPHAYSYFHISGVHYFTVLFVLIPSLSILYLVLVNSTKSMLNNFRESCLKVKLLLIISNLIAIGLPLAIVSRFQLLLSVLMAFMTYVYLKDNIRIRYIIIIVFMIIAAWIILSYFRHHSASYLNKIFEFNNKKTPVWISQPYTYICHNFENFNLMVNQFVKDDRLIHTCGLAMLAPIIALTGLKKLIPALSVVQVYTNKAELTTITMYYDAYYDFGIVGILILSLIIALMISYLEVSIFKANNKLHSILASQIIIYILLSFFTTWFSNPTTWFYLVVSGIYCLYCSEKI